METKQIEVFAQRRQRVLQRLGKDVLVLFSAPELLRNNDVEHPYRQDSDFFYLTGFDEPESALVLDPRRDTPFTLFVRPRDPDREVWTGRRAGVEGGRERFGADEALPISDLENTLPEMLRGRRRLHYRIGVDVAVDTRVLDAIKRARRASRRGGIYPTEIVDAGVLLHEMRKIKDDREIGLMRRACEITRDAHLDAMRVARPGGYEYQVEAAVRAAFGAGGAQRVAYEPIVAAGDNANVLHYVSNRSKLADGDLLLLDAGCEYDYYASDVTRTFPVNGRFNAEQRELYELVLESQKAAIGATRVGATLTQIHEAAVKVLAQGLIDLGVLQGSLDTALEEESYKPFYMHRTSHYLGMDVHDVGSHYDGNSEVPIELGVVITIEPGLYFASDNEAAPEKYRGIGIRIEDDVLVQPGAPRVLSDDVPKQPDDVEAACRA